MTNFDLDACLKIIPNKYELVLLAKTRTDEIVSGSSIMLQKSTNEKNFVTALREISDGFHDYYSLNEKTMTKIRNDISGVSVKINKEKDSTNDKFDEESLFAQIFQNFDNIKNDDSVSKLDDFVIGEEESSTGESNENLNFGSDKDSDLSDEDKLDFS